MTNNQASVQMNIIKIMAERSQTFYKMMYLYVYIAANSYVKNAICSSVN
jgi:hypothetical protein